MIACEKFPEQVGTRSEINALGLTDPSSQATESTQLTVDHYRIWDEIVQLYSSCELTKQSDKLIAIAGIAERMAVLMEDVYLWGMWKRKLPEGLPWCVKNTLEVTRPRPSVAPSWSWASICGIVEHPVYQTATRTPCLKILSVQDLAGDSVFQQSNQVAMLEVRSFMTIATLSQDGKDLEVYHHRADGERGGKSRPVKLGSCHVLAKLHRLRRSAWHRNSREYT